MNTYIYEIPAPRQEKLWITDLANIIKPETENVLNQVLTAEGGQPQAPPFKGGERLTEFKKYRSEIVILTVPDVSPYQNPRQLAKYIFNIWHITRIGFNRGALFLISQSDRKGEIIAGFINDPVEPTARDRKFQASIKNITAIDIFKLLIEERYEEGILFGTENLMKLIQNK